MSHVDKIIAMETALKDRLKATIRKSRRTIFLREDFAHLGGSYRQMSRVLSKLQDEQVIVRAGYGVYMRPTIQKVEDSVEQVLRRLGPRVRREVTIAGIIIQLGTTSTGNNLQSVQDRRKLIMARSIVEKFPLQMIRQRSLENMERWQKNGVWVSAFEEWRRLMSQGTDQEVLTIMIGEDETSNRLRQSAPYAGLLTQTEVEAIR